MKRLTLFAKGNLDVRDSLHALRLGGELRWNGINEVVRTRFPGSLVRVRHELWPSSVVLLASDGVPPPSLVQWNPPLDPFWPPVQYSRVLFEADADAFVLTIQPDVMTSLARHRTLGYSFYPANRDTWPPEDARRLRAEFDPPRVIDLDTSMSNFAKIVAELRERRDVPILIYNLSPVILGESLHIHAGMEDALSTRIRRFNLALIELSQQTGISIVDVDAVVARGGVESMMLDTLHFTAGGCRAVAEEVVRVLEDLGCFEAADTP